MQVRFRVVVVSIRVILRLTSSSSKSKDHPNACTFTLRLCAIQYDDECLKNNIFVAVIDGT